MGFISESDKARIGDAIRELESQTRGELVTVVAREADNYYYIPTMWAALFALALGAGLHLAHYEPRVLNITTVQVIAFIVFALLFRLSVIKLRLVPKAVQWQRAHRLACEQFLVQNLHHTEGRTGVLLFVSAAERYVEIIADRGINEAVTEGTWDTVVDGFVAQVQAGRIADGFIEAIGACGKPLIEHFPVVDGHNPNELPDRLVEL